MGPLEFGLKIGAFIAVALANSIYGLGTYVATESLTWCYMTQVTEDKIKLIPVWITILYGLIVTGGIFIMYASIYRHSRMVFRKAMRANARTLTDRRSLKDGQQIESSNISDRPVDSRATTTIQSGTQETKKEYSKRDRAILVRCVVIFLAFAMLYNPTFCLLWYRTLTQRFVPETLEAVASLMAVIDVVLSPSLFIYLNKEYRTALRDHVFCGLQSKSQ